MEGGCATAAGVSAFVRDGEHGHGESRFTSCGYAGTLIQSAPLSSLGSTKRATGTRNAWKALESLQG